MKRMSLCRSSAIGLSLLLLTGPAEAQRVQELRLTTPDAVFPESFSLISGLYEMSDGRLMIADPLGQALMLVDMESGRFETVGREGAGPEEYRQPDGIFPLPGDSMLLVDLGNGRLTALGPDGSFGPTSPIAQGEMQRGPGGMAGVSMVLPRAVDHDGWVYFQSMSTRGPGGGLPDSATVSRWHRPTGEIDSVGMVKLAERKQSVSGGSNNRSVSIRSVPLSPQDTWAAARDGRVAMVRAIDYHVEWIHPDGRVVRGSPVEYRPVPIRTPDKEEYVANVGSSGIGVGVSINNGVRTMSFSRGGMGMGGQSTPDIDSYEWPETKPPFVANGARVTPEGDLWVERSVPAGEPRTYDVFGEDGELKGRVVFPADRRLAGFGEGTVYLYRTDEFDLQYLERYRRTT